MDPPMYPPVYPFCKLFVLDNLCKEQMKLKVLDIGQWVRLPETMHELYAHLAQIIGRFCFFIGCVINLLLFRAQ